MNDLQADPEQDKASKKSWKAGCGFLAIISIIMIIAIISSIANSPYVKYYSDLNKKNAEYERGHAPTPEIARFLEIAMPTEGYFNKYENTGGLYCDEIPDQCRYAFENPDGEIQPSNKKHCAETIAWAESLGASHFFTGEVHTPLRVTRSKFFDISNSQAMATCTSALVGRGTYKGHSQGQSKYFALTGVNDQTKVKFTVTISRTDSQVKDGAPWTYSYSLTLRTNQNVHSRGLFENGP